MAPVAGSALRDCLGAESVDSSEAIYRYAAGGMVPNCVLKPRSIDEVCAAVRTARDGDLALISVGNGTHLDIGRPPRRYDAALATSRLDRIIAHDAADMTVTAEAGVTLGVLARALAPARQWLPLDPARSAEMTIGGLIAADRSGPLRCGYGKVRDWLIGVKVVGADGAVVHGGGRVVKNVAGYDLPKLFAGSFGTLGVIVEATFKVRPLPEGEALFLWPAPALAQAFELALRILGAPLEPVLLEAVNDAAAESLGLEASTCVVMGCAGAAAHLDEQERRLRELSGGAAQRVRDERVAALRRALSDFSQPENDEGIVARVSTLPTALASFLPEVERAAVDRRIVVEIGAHAANGVGWCQLLGAPSATVLAEFAAWLRAEARQRGAWVVFEALPPALRGRVDPWDYSEPAVRLMRGVKRALDPTDVFSPGRFVGGI